jgi:type III restriction enzyme
VEASLAPSQMELEGVTAKPDLAAIVKKTVALVVQQTISIPRILVVPKGEVASGFKPFTPNLSGLSYQPIPDELWVQFLRTGTGEVIGLGKEGRREERLEDYVVSGLVDFDDIDYGKHADQLYDLAEQTVAHFKRYLKEEDVGKVLWRHQKEIAAFLHAQMQEHYWEDENTQLEVVISRWFTELKPSAYTMDASEEPLDFKVSPRDKSNMSKYLFGGFARCLYPVQKFDSEAERILAVILDRDAIKWFKPAKGQFQIFYKQGSNQLEYQPDFVAETEDAIYMLEPKRRTALEDADVLAKMHSAKTWCEHASDYAAKHGGKPWVYRLIPHDTISENMSIPHLGKG